MGTIVVGVDGSSGSHDVLRFAVTETRLRNAPLRVVTAWRVSPLAYSGGFAMTVDPRVYEESAEAVGEEGLAAFREETVGVDVERAAKEGQAPHTCSSRRREAPIWWPSARADTLASQGLLLGSVSPQVVHHASCPWSLSPSPSPRLRG